MSPALIEGPAWVSGGLFESAGRFPLRVEGAVSRLVDLLVPGVITTTRHARYYAIHVLAWEEAAERGLSAEEAAAFVRRCEVVTAGVHHAHLAHRRRLSSAHGEDRLPRFLTAGGLDVDAAARLRTGLSQNGFDGVYRGALVRMRLLTRDATPRSGPRADLDAIREGLSGLVDLAERDIVSEGDLTEASHLCLCAAAESRDGEWLRRVMFETAESDNDDDLNRLQTCRMLLEALHPEGARDPEKAFRVRHGFGPPVEGDDPRTRAASAWRAAVLRNYSVSAWRELWRWLALQLREPMTAAELGDRLADEVGDASVRDFVERLPPRRDGEELLPAEEELRSRPVSPIRELGLLALGSQRLEDISGETKSAFVGSDRDDLGPDWFRGQLEEYADDRLPTLARELVDVLVRRAKRVAVSKMEMRDGQIWIPSRLRDRNGLLTIVGEEGAGDVALRQSSLSEVLAGLAVVERGPDDIVRVTPLGEELRERLG